MNKLQDKLSTSETKYKEITSQTDSKVDKMLIKNLIIGLVSSNSIALTKDQNQVLKIIATVLDFNQQESEKVQLNKSQHGGWLSSILQPSTSDKSMNEQSLSEAFVRFLENESKPKVLPNLLHSNSIQRDGSDTTVARQSPVALNEVVLPTFAEFGMNRNSSSILKDVLKDSAH